MAKSNWKGSSGWTAIDDPTGVLEGRVLVASAGSSQTTEDYLTEIVGTSSAFDISHYCVKMEYAYTRSSYQFEAGSLGLIALATNYSGGAPYTAQDCYLAYFNNETQTVNLVRRKNSVENILNLCLVQGKLAKVSRYFFKQLHFCAKLKTLKSF